MWGDAVGVRFFVVLFIYPSLTLSPLAVTAVTATRTNKAYEEVFTSSLGTGSLCLRHPSRMGPGDDLGDQWYDH